MDDRQWSPRVDWTAQPFRDPEGHCTPSFSVNRIDRARIIIILLNTIKYGIFGDLEVGIESLLSYKEM